MADELVAEINDMTRLLSSKATGMRKVLLMPMARGLAHKVVQLPHVSITDATALLDALELCPLCSEGHELVGDAVAHHLEGACVEPAAPTGTYKGQILLAIGEYLTLTDWATLDNPATTPVGASLCVIERLHKLGVDRIHEQTVRMVMSLLTIKQAEREKGFPWYADIYNNVVKLKQDFYSVAAALPVRMQQYPATPKLLPKELYDQAYDLGDPPISVVVPRLHVVAKAHIPLRSTSKLLGKRAQSNAAWKDDAPLTIGGLRALMAEPANQSPFAHLAGPGEDLRRSFVPRQTKDSRGHSPFTFRPQTKNCGVMAPASRLPDAVASADHAQTNESALPWQPEREEQRPIASSLRSNISPEESEPEMGTEDGEEKVLRALLTRDAKRQAAAKKKNLQESDAAIPKKIRRMGKTSEGVMRRPAALPESPPVLRRPASLPKSPPALCRPACVRAPPRAGHQRPLPSKKPTPYLQGKLYVDDKQKRVRAYKHLGDKVESSFNFKARPFNEAWAAGCGAIEAAATW